MTEKMTRRTMLGAFGAAAGLAGRNAYAADWPSRTITIIAGFPAGGPTDVVARLLADNLSKALGQAVIVENRSGASGTTAAAYVSRSTPDGYTLSVIPSGHASAAATFAHLPYRSVDDFSMISMICDYPYVMCTNAASGIKTVGDLLHAARTRSSPLLFGTPGVGSGPQLAIELFALKTKIKVQHIPFRGSAPAALELLAGRLDFMMDPPVTLIPHIRSGKLNALAVSSAQRYFALPDTPTIAESGVPGFDVSAWQGLIGPAGLPAPIVTRLNAEVGRMLKEPANVQKLHAFGDEATPSTPEEFKKRLTGDIALWTNVADEIHFKKI
jgi:tripartite-type tricarboxylate transporter receptor subunit TctC